MNKKLLTAIVSHIFAQFAIISSDFVDHNKTESLHKAKYMLSEKINFSDEDNNCYKGDIYGCTLSVMNNDVKVLFADCSLDFHYPEYVLMIQSKDQPIYGLYLNGDDNMLSVSLDGSIWMECNTFLQATFLAAMEQMKDLGITWSHCSDYQTIYKSMLLFIKFYNSKMSE